MLYRVAASVVQGQKSSASNLQTPDRLEVRSNAWLQSQHYEQFFKLSEPQLISKTSDCTTFTLISVLRKDKLLQIVLLARGHHQSVKDYHRQEGGFSWSISTHYSTKASHYTELYRNHLAQYGECMEKSATLNPSNFIVLQLSSKNSSDADSPITSQQLKETDVHEYVCKHEDLEVLIQINFGRALLHFLLKDVSKGSQVLDSIEGTFENTMVCIESCTNIYCCYFTIPQEVVIVNRSCIALTQWVWAFIKSLMCIISFILKERHLFLQGGVCGYFHDSESSGGSEGSSAGIDPLDQLDLWNIEDDTEIVTIVSTFFKDTMEICLHEFVAGKQSEPEKPHEESDKFRVTKTEIRNDFLHAQVEKKCESELYQILTTEQCNSFKRNTPKLIVSESIPSYIEDLASIIPKIETVKGRNALDYCHSKNPELFVRVFEPRSPSDNEIHAPNQQTFKTKLMFNDMASSANTDLPLRTELVSGSTHR